MLLTVFSLENGMPLKRVGGLVLALVSLAGLLPATAGDATASPGSLAAVRARGVRRVGLFAVDTPPVYFLDGARNEMAGSDVELA